jgi:hypothetical protein
MLSQRFNKFCLPLLVEKVDDYFNDGTFGFDNNGAREFVFVIGADVFIHNVGNVGSTHSTALNALVKASNDKIQPNENGLFEVQSAEGDTFTYEITGNYRGLNITSEKELILGRYWDKRDSRINNLKPFGFWVYGDVNEGEEGIDKFITQNNREIKMIVELLGILAREYYYQFNYLSGPSKNFFKSFRKIRSLRNGYTD